MTIFVDFEIYPVMELKIAVAFALFTLIGYIALF